MNSAPEETRRRQAAPGGSDIRADRRARPSDKHPSVSAFADGALRISIPATFAREFIPPPVLYMPLLQLKISPCSTLFANAPAVVAVRRDLAHFYRPVFPCQIVAAANRLYYPRDKPASPPPRQLGCTHTLGFLAHPAADACGIRQFTHAGMRMGC